VSGVRFRERKPRKQVDLNVTSLVDVLFLLLIFFTLTSTFKRAGEIELNLPRSTTAVPAGSANSKPLDVVLTEHGTLLLDGAPTTFDGLLPKLRTVAQQQPDREVMIDAEEHVGHGQVVRLLDAVRAAGFKGVSIGVRNAAPAPGGRVH
jgi:biopolymer transport protein ExbD